MNQKRNWEKIVREYEVGDEPVKDFCRAKEIHPTPSYKNRKSLRQGVLVEILQTPVFGVDPIVLQSGDTA